MTRTDRERPWLDSSLDVEQRVESLLHAMTLTEKIGQLHQIANADPDDHGELVTSGRLGSCLVASGPLAGNVRDEGVTAARARRLQELARTGSRLGIPLLVARDVIHGHRTVFPIPLAQAASWDPELVASAAAIAAGEARVDGIDWVFTPMLDITYDPRWGRVAEGFGEDPFLASTFAAAAVRGYQSDLGATTVAACAKHYVGYGAAEGGRDYSGASLGGNTLRNVHLRPFHAAVQAGVLSVMAAFSEIDGVPMTANWDLVRGVLKEEWGFDGIVVSDWNAVAELIEHGVAADLSDAARQAMLAGIDVDMVSGAYDRHLAELVASGRVSQELVDDAVARVLRIKFRLGLFDVEASTAAAATLRGGPIEPAPTEQTRAVARRLATRSLVLLHDRGTHLPLGGRGQDRQGSILLTGPFATARAELFGTWTLDGRGSEVEPLCDVLPRALRERWGDAAPDVVVNSGAFPDLVLTHARDCDLAVVALGEHPLRSGEANSVVDPTLPAGQLDLLRALNATGCPVIAVVFAGRPLVLTEVVPLCDALLLAWHPGIEGAQAISDVLVGAAEAGGRLPVTFPHDIGQIPIHYDQKRTGRPVAPADDRVAGRYLDSGAAPLFPFGFGLNAGQVAYGAPTCAETPDGDVIIAVELHNQGAACTEVVQVYLRDVVARVTRPLRELVGFERVELGGGERRDVRVVVRRNAFGYWDSDRTFVVEPGAFVLGVGPNSAAVTEVPFRLH